MDAERTRRPGRCVRIGARYLPIEHVKQIAEAEHPRQSAVLCYSRQHRTWHNPTHTQRFVFYASYTPRSKFRKYNPAIISLHATTPIRYSPVEPHRLVWYAVASRCPLDRSPWSGKRPPPSRAALLCFDATNIEVTHSIQQLSMRVLNCLP